MNYNQTAQYNHNKIFSDRGRPKKCIKYYFIPLELKEKPNTLFVIICKTIKKKKKMEKLGKQLPLIGFEWLEIRQ